MSEVETRVAAVLTARAAELCARWSVRAPVVSAVSPTSASACDAPVRDLVEEIIRGVSASLDRSAFATSRLASASWHFGRVRYDAGRALDGVMHELHLLDAMVLRAAEEAASDPAVAGSVGEGVALARGIRRATSLVSMTAVRGFTSAEMEQQRRQLRGLRHDLRNPLGTIRSAMALLEDESIPAHRRDLGRYRAIVSRNAAQADGLVTRNLSDVGMFGRTFARREVAIADVAFAVRRALREQVEVARAEVVITDGLPIVRVDPACLELVLLVALAGVLEAEAAEDRSSSPAGAATRIAVEPDALAERSVRIRITGASARASESAGLLLARELARQAGGELSMPDALVLELPVSPRQTRDDVRRTRER